MKIFKCDKCKKEFEQPLDEVIYTDEHGITHIFDMCASCRKGLKTEEAKPKKTYFEKMLKG